MSVGVIIGRFQVADLHDGHSALINQVLEKHDQVVVFIGVRPGPRSKRNPLTYAERAEMIRETYFTVHTLPLTDCRDDVSWSKQIDRALQLMYPEAPCKLYGGRDSFIPHYVGRHEVIQLQEGDETAESGTVQRAAIAEQVCVNSDWRRGIIRAVHANYPRVQVTCDVAALRNYGNGVGWSVLLGKKPGEVEWRFPGGFFDEKKDSSLEDTATRELHEETGIISEARPMHICSAVIHDWRCVDLEDVNCLTHLYAIPYSHGPVQAGDDLAEVKWCSLSALRSNQLVPEHRGLWATLATWVCDNDHRLRD